MSVVSRFIDRLQPKSRGASFTMAFFAVLAATFGQWVFWPLLNGTRFMLFYPAVVLSAVSGGFGPGLLATCLSALVVDYFFMPPAWSFFGELARRSAPAQSVYREWGFGQSDQHAAVLETTAFGGTSGIGGQVPISF